MIPFVAILISAIASMVLGFLWYGPVFGAIWMKLVGLSKKDTAKRKQGMGMMYGSMYVLNVIMAAVLFYLLKWTAGSTICPFIGENLALKGATLGFFGALGFAMTGLGANYLANKKSCSLYAIDAGYMLVNASLVGLVLGALLML